MSIHFRTHGDSLVIVGHTYPHRDTLRALGAQFDRELKAWRLRHSVDAAAQLQELCAQYGGGPLSDTPAPRETIVRPPPAAPQELAAATAGLTVSELMNMIQMKLALAFPQTIWVVGEIHNLQKRGRAVYLQLSEAKTADSSSQASISVSATIWSQVWQRLVTDTARYGALSNILADGVAVRVLCQVGLYRDRGAVSLNIIDVDPAYSLGALALAREKLRRELQQLGLDRKNKLLTMPRFPFRVGLISAQDSRAKSDFCDQLLQYGFPGELLFQDARMQGESTVAQILAALEELKSQACDVIVLTRGGGSAADLRWFDDRNLAFAIANCEIPIIAAIGHHDDTCIAEEIAHHREKTPTAAADFIAGIFQTRRFELERYLSDLASKSEQACLTADRKLSALEVRLRLAAEQLLARHEQTLSSFLHRLDANALASLTYQDRRCTDFENKIDKQWMQYYFAAAARLQDLGSALKAADPLPWIHQGWTQLSQNAKPLKSIHDIVKGTTVKARLKDGSLLLEVLDTVSDKTHNAEGAPT